MTPRRSVELLGDAGLYLFALALPFNLWSVQAGLGLATLSLLLRHFWLREALRFPAPLWAPISLYVAAIGLSLAGSGEPPPTLHTALGFWPVLAPLVLAAAIPDTRTLRRMWWLAGGMAALMGLYGVLQHYTGADWFRVHTTLSKPAPATPGRFLAIGNFEAHTTYAFTLAFPALMAVALLAQASSRWRERLAFFGVAALCSAGILLSYVRAVWVGLIVGFGAMALLRRGAWLRASLVLVLLGGTLVAVSPSLRARALSVVDPTYNVGRAYIWERSWRMLADHPVSGIGFGTYRRLQDAYFDPAAPPEEVPRTGAHSTYLHLLVETGALGLLAFLWLWVRFFRVAAATYRRLRVTALRERALVTGGAAGVACFLLGSFFQEAFFDGEVAFMLWFAVSGVFVVARDSDANAA